MDITEARIWATTAVSGEYLIRYEDSGLTDAEDPGSRCGFDDAELDEIRSMLGARDLGLSADDRGLVAHAQGE